MALSLQIGQRVEVVGKGVQGSVAYIGTTMFASGKWIGVILDEGKGRNNGTVQGKQYFQCKENHGIFVRPSQLCMITDSGSRIDLSSSVTSVASSDDGSAVSTPVSSVPTATRISSISRLPTSSRSKKSKSREELTRSTPNIKRASFVETEFVETLNPQFTPGEVVVTPPQSNQPMATPPLTGPQKAAQALVQSQHNKELEELNEKIKDLTEKLDTLRFRYKDKSHEAEQVKLQLEQSVEFKAKIMDSQAHLKKEIERLKKEKEDALEAKEDLADLADTLEMATLDKEMAEEKAESLQRELEQANEKITELEMQLEVLKVERTEKLEGIEVGDDPQVVVLKIKQLETQNEKLKETLVKLRDVYAQEKHEKQNLEKEYEEKKSDVDQLMKMSDKLKAKVEEMEEQIADLHSQVDASLGAEEMVETLGQQKLTLEDKVKELEEAVADLEELHDINEQLQEGFQQQELDFRQELDSKNLLVWEAQRKTDQVLESLADRELTIAKFRDLVSRIQEENHDLRVRLESSSKTASLPMSTGLPPEFMDFKKMFAETKAHARAIDLELRHMEVQQTQQHVKYLLAFMPDSFIERGDSEAVMVVLLMPRLLTKAQILINQLRDKFPPVDSVDKASLNHSVHQYAARCRFTLHLHLLQTVLHQFVHACNICTPEALIKTGKSYPDLAQQEKVLDGYIDLLKRDQLDENVNTESLERAVNFFTAIQSSLLGETEQHQGLLLADTAIALLCGIDSLTTDAAILLLLVGDEKDPLGSLCSTIRVWGDAMRQHLRGMKRRLDALPRVANTSCDLTLACSTVAKMAKIMAQAARQSLPAFLQDTDSPVDSSVIVDTMIKVYEKLIDREKDRSVLEYMKHSVDSLLAHVANTALTLQEYEEKYSPLTDNKPDPTPAVFLRAEAIKKELNSSSTKGLELEQKNEKIRELKLAMRKKQEELSEMNLRRELCERKLESLKKDKETSEKTLQKKIQDMEARFTKKEKEFEETMDHLQKDIDTLELEKGELKDKLKTHPKKGYDSIRSSPSSLVSIELGGSVKVVENPILVNQIRHLKSQLKLEKAKRVSLENRHWIDRFYNLKPLEMPKKANQQDLKRVDELVKEVKSLEEEMLESLPQIIDLGSLKDSDPINLDRVKQTIINNELKQRELNNKMHKIEGKINKEIIRRKEGGFITTDLTTFPTPQMTKAMKEHQPVKICEISVATDDPKLQNRNIAINLTLAELLRLKKTIFSVGV